MRLVHDRADLYRPRAQLRDLVGDPRLRLRFLQSDHHGVSTQIQKSLGMTLPQTGLIVSMTLAGSVIGGVAIGWLGDQIGRKNALLASLALLAAGSILSAFAWDFGSLLAFRFITGIGVGSEWGAGMVLLNEVWRSERRGFGSCVVQAMSAAGTAIAVLVATYALTNLSENQSWRAAFLFGG